MTPDGLAHQRPVSGAEVANASFVTDTGRPVQKFVRYQTQLLRRTLPGSQTHKLVLLG